MSGTSPTTIRLMTNGDLSAADDLRQQAGWNQLPGDWKRIVDYQPDGCFVAVQDDRVVGTVTTTCYPATSDLPSLAWIGMMLVHPDFRRQGIATRLMKQALQFLNGSNIECIKLDATPTGAPVYERLGFCTEWTFHRWFREKPSTSERYSPTPQPLLDANLDLQAFGADRSHWLNLLAADSTVIADRAGFGMIRPGATARYLGPVTALNPDVAGRIVTNLLAYDPGAVFWDIPSPNQACEQLAERLGFVPVRELTRMWMGRQRIKPNLFLQFALSDPGTG